MKTIIYTAIEKSIMNEWLALWEKSEFANYTNSPYWFLSVIENFNYKNFVILAIYEEKNLVAIAGLIKAKKYGVSVYQFFPTNAVYGNPFLVKKIDTELLKTITNELLHLGSVFLENIPQSLLDLLATNTSDILATKQALNYYLPIKKVNGVVVMPKRKDFMRKARGIEEKFVLKSSDDAAVLDKIFALDEQSSKQKQGYNAFADEKTRKFYTVLKRHFKKHLLVNLLYFENTLIAYEVGFVIGKTYFGNLISYHSDYAEYTPGKILVAKLIDYLGTLDLEKMDLGSGDNYLKRLLSKEYNDLFEVVISKKQSVRNYLINILKSKNSLYQEVQKKKKLYSTYREVRNLLHR